MKSKYLVGLLTVVTLASGLVNIGTATPALAHDQGYTYCCPDVAYQWNQYHAVGYCPFTAEVSSRYVKSVKAILWAAGHIADINNINQTFNSTTAGNLKEFQRAHGLQDDGCAGPDTWDKMQNAGHYDPQLGQTLHHMYNEGTLGGCCGYFYRWRETYLSNSRWVRYYRPAQYFYCWNLNRARNDSTNTTVMMVHGIDHDGNDSCNG